MSDKTNIQWCDSTVNPVMGCDGCPLFPTPTEVADKIAKKLVERGYSFDESKKLLKERFAEMTFTELYFRRAEVGESIASAMQGSGEMTLGESAFFFSEEIRSALKCYAATLHIHRGEDPTDPSKEPNKGYAPTFEQVTLFPGRMKAAAGLPNLTGDDRPESPWRNGLPRLIFVSDMGDALSKAVEFDYLKKEIIEIVNSDLGRRHIWLWLTKRPERMADFDRWLKNQDIPWPDNLIPMTTILNQSMVNKARKLLKIRARAFGLSIEPLWERLNIDLTGWSWVIVGGESGSHPKPFHLEWARELYQQSSDKGVAFFMKQIGQNPFLRSEPVPKTLHPHGGNWNEWPEDLRVSWPPKFGH